MKNKDRALNAIATMTKGASQTKLVAKYAVNHNEFYSMDIQEKTGVPAKNMSRIINCLIKNYGFVFDIQVDGSRFYYQLTDCTFDGKRISSNGDSKSSAVKVTPLKRPISINPLWASLLYGEF